MKIEFTVSYRCDCRSILFRWSNSMENPEKLAEVTCFLQFSTSSRSLSYCDAPDIKFQCMLVSFGMRHALVAGYSMISRRKTAVIGIPNMVFALAACEVSAMRLFTTLLDLDVRLRFVNFYKSLCKSLNISPLFPASYPILWIAVFWIFGSLYE